MIGIASCIKENSPVITEKLPAKVSVVFPPVNANPDTVSDVDGNIYKTVKIGDIIWMAENLRSVRFNDGSLIPNITDNSDWKLLKSSAYRWYDNNEIKYRGLYGALYNWYAVNSGRLCPEGWHVPSDEEWSQLELTLGMEPEEAYGWGDWFTGRGTDQGTQMRTTVGWDNIGEYDGNGTDASGFSGLPGGESDYDGQFDGAGITGNWWSSTPYYREEVFVRVLNSCNPGVLRITCMKNLGCSVRCIRDYELKINR